MKKKLSQEKFNKESASQAGVATVYELLSRALKYILI